MSIVNVPSLGGSDVAPLALNANGQMTGYAQLPGGSSGHAFISSGITSLDVGTLGGNLSLGLSINAAGQVVGESFVASGAKHAFFYHGGALQDLGTLGGTQSTAVAINDAGQIAGTSLTVFDETEEAFLYAGGVLRTLGHLGGLNSRAVAINQAGAVVGDSDTLAEGTHAFIWTGSSMLDLGTLGGPSSAAKAVNDAGVVAGNSTTALVRTHAFIYANGHMTDLGTLGGDSSTAVDINEAAQVIGDSTTGAGETHGFIYTGGTMVDLGTLGGVSSSARAINDQGQVVGISTTASGVSLPFLWQSGSMLDLNSVLPAGSGWQLSTASFITDTGYIAGKGTYNGVYQAYILKLGGGAENNHPPVAQAGADQAADCSSSITLNGSASSDPDNDLLTYEWSLLGNVVGTGSSLTMSFPAGESVVTLKVTDPCGAFSTDTVTVRIADTQPPVVSAVQVNPSTLQVPNHKLVRVTVQVTATDGCDAAPVSKIVRITSNQPLSDGETRITGNLTALLAASRSPALGDRIYTLHVETTDASGNTAPSTVHVVVPRGQANLRAGK